MTLVKDYVKQIVSEKITCYKQKNLSTNNLLLYKGVLDDEDIFENLYKHNIINISIKNLYKIAFRKIKLNNIIKIKIRKYLACIKLTFLHFFQNKRN